MNKVTAISGRIAAATGEPDQETITQLATLLERAQAGDIVGIAFVTITENGTVGTGWKGRGESMRLASGVALLNHRYFTAYNEAPDR